MRSLSPGHLTRHGVIIEGFVESPVQRACDVEIVEVCLNPLGYLALLDSAGCTRNVCRALPVATQKRSGEPHERSRLRSF